MENLNLVKSEHFCGIECDFYGDGNELWMTREQIGSALGYSDPLRAISKLHARKKNRLDKYSVVVNMTTTDGKQYDTTLYNRKGIMEICRHSGQPKADDFMDFAWDVMDSIASGKAILSHKTTHFQSLAEVENEHMRVRKAEILSHIADGYDGTYRQILQAYATKELVGKFILPLPDMPKETYTAEEIGAKLKISANMVGRIANANNLKTDEYGQWFVDKAKHSAKEVRSFRYFDRVIPKIKSALNADE